MTLKGLKEYAHAKGVLAKVGVTSELTTDLSWKNQVSEMAENCKKAPCNSARPLVNFVLGGSVTGRRLTRADTYIEEHASGVGFPLTSVVHFITF
jgi:hypothetical protein